MDLRSWLELFRLLAGLPRPLDSGDYLLTAAEQKDLGRSMAIFALGESSHGEVLIEKVRAWGERQGVHEVEELTRLFIAEENRHSRSFDDLEDLSLRGDIQGLTRSRDQGNRDRALSERGIGRDPHGAVVKKASASIFELKINLLDLA